jgi:hypothetical protein
MFDQLSSVIVPSLTKGRHNNTTNNKAKCIPGGTLRVLAGKNIFFYFLGALGQAVHQAVSKMRPKPPKLDIAFAPDLLSKMPENDWI